MNILSVLKEYLNYKTLNFSIFDLKNGNNTNLAPFSLLGLGNVCIHVDDEDWSYANWNTRWSVTYSEDCP